MTLRELMFQLEVLDRLQNNLDVVVLTYDDQGNDRQHPSVHVRYSPETETVFLEGE